MSTSHNHINGYNQRSSHHNPTTSNGFVSHGLSSGYNNQLDNEFINHRASNNSNNNNNNNINNNNQSEMSSTTSSVQMTRLTSKTALLVRQRRAMLEPLRCFLCKGYLIDATTIDECMDSFCRSCIVVHLRNHNNCPKCRIKMQRPLEETLRPDKTLQDVVYKMIPGLYDDEMKRRRLFYRGYTNGSNNSSSSDEDEPILLNGGSTILTGERYGIVGQPKPFYNSSDTIDLSIEPQPSGENAKIYYDNKRHSIVTCIMGSLQQRDLNLGPIFTAVDSRVYKTYLRCPGKFSVAQLKKFIAAKFSVHHEDTIRLLYINDPLEDSYSLIDLAYIYNWDRQSGHMKLYYIIERDLTKVKLIDIDGGPLANGDQPRAVTRQQSSVGTQVTKRVCIDPEPRFYSDKSNDVANPASTNSHGRSMRPRNVDTNANNLNRAQVKAVATNPIIKNPTVDDKRTQFVYSNGLQTRNVQSVNKFSSGPANSTEPSRSLRSLQPTTGTNSQSTDRTSGNSICSNNDNDSNDTNRNLGSRSNDPKRYMASHTNNNANRDGDDQSTTPSSLATLASFAETRTSHVMATVTATTSSHTTTTLASSTPNSYASLSNSHQAFQRSAPIAATTATTKSIVASGNSSAPAGIPSVPQLAFSIVTERGVTIRVRRLETNDRRGDQDDKSSSHVNRAPALTTTANLQQIEDGSSHNHNEHSQPNNQHNHRSTISSSFGNLTRTSVGTSQNSSPASSPPNQPSGSAHRNSDSNESVTPRAQIKVRPVYKTFVDPTKLKSPNFKKLGFTAKH